jgi:hypothetical protein
MNNQYRNIQRHTIINPMMGVNEPYFEFTFLDTPLEDRTPAERMEDVTHYIRQTLVQHYHFDPNEAHTFLVEWFPNEEAYEYLRQRTFGRISTITGDIFMNIFSGMLHSDDTLELVGMRIGVQLIGSRLNRQVAGAGCTPGARVLPQHLKKMGLITHPLIQTYANILSEVKLCGLLAILLLKDKDYTTKTRFFEWLEAGKRLGTTLGIDDGIVRNEHFQELLQLEGWSHYRVVIFTNTKGLQAVFQGPDW